MNAMTRNTYEKRESREASARKSFAAFFFNGHLYQRAALLYNSAGPSRPN